MNMIEEELLLNKAKKQYGNDIEIIEYDTSWPNINNLLWIKLSDGNIKPIIEEVKNNV